jgi:hypothetical protein
VWGVENVEELWRAGHSIVKYKMVENIMKVTQSNRAFCDKGWKPFAYL